MRRRVQFGVGILLLALTTQGYASMSAVSRARSAAARGPQPHTPGYLGIGFRDTPGGHGVEIVLVDHDGPAGKTGLKPHDLIVSMNGQAVNSSELLSRMIHEMGPGTSITLSMQRDGKAMNVKVQLVDHNEVDRIVRARAAAADVGDADPPVSEFAAGGTVAPASPNATPSGGRSFLRPLLHGAPFTGLALQTMEPQLAEYFGDAQGIGLLVQMVMPNSPAAFSGLRAGDVVLRADTVALKTPSDWSKHVRSNAGQPMVLTVWRDKHEISVTLTPELKHHSLLEWPRLF